MNPTPTTYAGAGVSYADIDPIKMLAQKFASHTTNGPSWLGVKYLEEFRGESAAVFRLPDGSHISHVEEGLGTLVLMAEAIYRKTGDTHGLSCCGINTIQAIGNDAATTGIPLISMQMHLGAGANKYLQDERAMSALLQGWADGCIAVGACWSGGETPVLPTIINPESSVIAGSAVGWLPAPYRPISEKVRDGDAIILLPSSGLHCNGISLVRKIGEAQPDGGIELFKEALTPAFLYVEAVNALVQGGITLNYMIHITGHGWRKLMRAKSEHTYRIELLPEIPSIFTKVQRLGGISDEEMWGNYNMGAGFALIIKQHQVSRAVGICERAGFSPLVAGYVEKGPKRVIIEPAGITFKADSMQLR